MLGSQAEMARFRFGLTYIDHLLDEIRHPALCEDLALRRLMLEQNIEGCVLVAPHSLIPRTTDPIVRTSFKLS